MGTVRAQIYFTADGVLYKHSIRSLSRAQYAFLNMTALFRAVSLPANDKYGHLLPGSILPERFDAAIRKYRSRMRASARAAGGLEARMI